MTVYYSIHPIKFEIINEFQSQSTHVVMPNNKWRCVNENQLILNCIKFRLARVLPKSYANIVPSITICFSLVSMCSPYTHLSILRLWLEITDDHFSVFVQPTNIHSQSILQHGIWLGIASIEHMKTYILSFVNTTERTVSHNLKNIIVNKNPCTKQFGNCMKENPKKEITFIQSSQSIFVLFVLGRCLVADRETVCD